MVCAPVQRDIPELYLTCTMISSVDLAHYGVSRATDMVTAYCGTMSICNPKKLFLHKICQRVLFVLDILNNSILYGCSVLRIRRKWLAALWSSTIVQNGADYDNQLFTCSSTLL